jgi:large subunit ribosomal protein L25
MRFEMSEKTTIVAEFREDVGKGASRRLRHAGKVPAVIYGGHRDPVALTLQQDTLLHAAEKESFYASILAIKVGDRMQQAVVRDMQRHPFKPIIMHIDFMRVSAEEILRMSVPIHFIGEDLSPAGKASGVVIQHQMTEVEIAALPRNLPEFVEVDLSQMKAGDVVMLSNIRLPEGVTIPALSGAGERHDATVANAVHVKADQGTGAAATAEAQATLAGELGEPGAVAGAKAATEGEKGGEKES